MSVPRHFRRFAPGIWEDAEGAVHLSVPELLAHFNVEDTPENRDACAKMMEEILREKWPQAKITQCP